MQMQKSGLRGDVIMNMIKASKSSRDKDKDKAKYVYEITRFRCASNPEIHAHI